MSVRNFARGVAAVGISLLMFMILLEVTLQIYTRLFIYYDIEMSRYAIEVKQKSDNPKIGHVHRPNVESRLMGVDVVINSDGLRDDEYPIERNDHYRIAVLGDSLTFGWGVEATDSFAAILEETLSERSPVEMINFGTGNYNTEQQVNLFLEKGLKYSPDKVVVFYFINDAEPTPERSRWNWVARSRSITFFWSRVRSLITRLRSSQTFESFYRSLYQDDQPGWLTTQQAFLELRAIAEDEGIELQVVMLPELHDLMEYPFETEYAKVAEFLTENEIAVLNLTPSFLGIEDARSLWVAPDDAHPNDVAHRMIAEYARPFVAQGLGEDG